MDYPSQIKVGDRDFKVLYEKALKRTSSVRIKNGAVVLKLSRYSFGRARDQVVTKFLKWAEKKLKKVKKSDFGEQSFENGTSIVTHNKVYELKVNVNDGRKKVKLLDGGVIEVSANKKSEVRELVEKTIIKDQTPYLKEVIDELNQLHFQKNYNMVRFKRVSSRFGSCSSKGNINIALRLLFSPREIFRYVCIHELAHLKEMNHSAVFWALVEEAMPEYKDAERWLRNNGFMLG
ncbi:MAG: M48 family metallopeptidase [Nitrospirota bacterium]